MGRISAACWNACWPGAPQRFEEDVAVFLPCCWPRWPPRGCAIAESCGRATRCPWPRPGQMLGGKTLYRDVWYDKPPLVPVFHLLSAGRAGWGLRLADALYALACCLAAFGFARDMWGRREAFWAAALMGLLAHVLPSLGRDPGRLGPAAAGSAPGRGVAGVARPAVLERGAGRSGVLDQSQSRLRGGGVRPLEPGGHGVDCGRLRGGDGCGGGVALGGGRAGRMVGTGLGMGPALCFGHVSGPAVPRGPRPHPELDGFSCGPDGGRGLVSGAAGAWGRAVRRAALAWLGGAGAGRSRGRAALLPPATTFCCWGPPS